MSQNLSGQEIKVIWILATDYLKAGNLGLRPRGYYLNLKRYDKDKDDYVSVNGYEIKPKDFQITVDLLTLDDVTFWIQEG